MPKHALSRSVDKVCLNASISSDWKKLLRLGFGRVLGRRVLEELRALGLANTWKLAET